MITVNEDGTVEIVNEPPVVIERQDDTHEIIEQEG